MLFDAVDPAGRPVYHTNVLMCIGTEFAMIGLSAITDPVRRAQVRRRVEETGRTVIDLSAAQVREFAGNAIELTGSSGRLLALSARAMRALDEAQLRLIAASATPVPVGVGAIELAGGSVRCMIAGIHLARRDGHPAGDVPSPGPAGGAARGGPGMNPDFPVLLVETTARRGLAETGLEELRAALGRAGVSTQMRPAGDDMTAFAQQSNRVSAFVYAVAPATRP